jgi:phage-related protein
MKTVSAAFCLVILGFAVLQGTSANPQPFLGLDGLVSDLLSTVGSTVQNLLGAVSSTVGSLSPIVTGLLTNVLDTTGKLLCQINFETNQVLNNVGQIIGKVLPDNTIVDLKGVVIGVVSTVQNTVTFLLTDVAKKLLDTLGPELTSLVSSVLNSLGMTLDKLGKDTKITMENVITILQAVTNACGTTCTSATFETDCAKVPGATTCSPNPGGSVSFCH